MFLKISIIKGSLITLALLCIALLNTVPAKSQISNFYYTGADKKKIDTLSMLAGERIVKESAGLLEIAIDPEHYLLGPNDMLLITILTANPIEMELSVSPDGRLLIPGVGVVDVNLKPLSVAERLIKEKIQKVYKTNEIHIVLSDIRKFKVTVSGSVTRPAIVAATAADRVSEIIEKAGGMKFDASLRRIKLVRHHNNQVHNVDLLKFYLLGDKDANPTVLGGDYIIVPPSKEDQFIRIEGEVGLPGDFEFVEGDKLSTLIRFGHGFLESSNLDSVELVRFIRGDIIETQIVNISHWRENFDRLLTFPDDIDLRLGDRVYIRKISGWYEDKYIVIRGAVNLPGYYAIHEGKDRIRDLIERAGGFRADASLENSFLVRMSQVSEDEEPEMRRLRTIPASEMSENERRYFQSRIMEIRGIMAIDFQNIMKDYNSEDNIFVVHEDSIHVHTINNFVNVQGRVNNPGNITFKSEYNYEDYIALAGGYGFRADADAALVVKSKGQQYLAKSKNYRIEPGDFILVPPESEITFFDIFMTGLTITTQIMTVLGVVVALVRMR